MIRLFHYNISIKFDTSISVLREFTVIAQDESEAFEELTLALGCYDNIVSWCIAETLDIEELAVDNVHAIDYSSKGAHSYYEPLETE